MNTLTKEKSRNFEELNRVYSSLYSELEPLDAGETADDLEPIDNAAYLRYYVDGLGIYFSEQGNMLFEEISARQFHLNTVREATELKSCSLLPAEISAKLEQLRTLNEKYQGRHFTVIAENRESGTIIVSGADHTDAYWELAFETFNELSDELIETLEHETPDSSFAEPVQGI